MVNKSTSTGLFSFAASFYVRSTSSRTRASPLIRRAVPEVRYFWIADLVSNVDGVRRRNVTVAPSSVVRRLELLRGRKEAGEGGKRRERGKGVPRSLSEEKYPMLRDPPMVRIFRSSVVDMLFQGGFGDMFWAVMAA